MTEITIVKKNDIISSIDITGHADSAPYGYDLICNSLTVATQILGIGIGVLEIEPLELVFEPSIPKVHFEFDDIQAKKCKNITQTFFEYVNLIAKEHEKYIKLEVI